MISYSDEIVIFSVCIFGSLIIFASIIYYFFLQLKNKKKSNTFSETVKKRNSFFMSGNLVSEYSIPITTNYHLKDSILGRGSSAEVVIGIHHISRRRYAIKVIDVSGKNIDWKYEREKSILKDVHHTNVIRLFEVYSTKFAQYFVMELCTGGNLDEILKKKKSKCLDENISCLYITQLTKAIAHCHSHGICHRDIKLQNILLENTHANAQIKLIDFGNAARFHGNCPLTKIVGTTYTVAPEVFKRNYDERCDIWSIGVVAYILLCGKRPFEGLELPINLATTRSNKTQNAPNNTGINGLNSNQSISSSNNINIDNSCSCNSSRNNNNNNSNNNTTTPTKLFKSKDSSIIASILLGRYHFLHDTFENISFDAIHFIQACLHLNYKNRKSASSLLNLSWLFNSNNTVRSISSRSISSILPDPQCNLAYMIQKRIACNFSTSYLKKVAMIAVAFHLTTNKLYQARLLFQQIDKDHIGAVEYFKFRDVMLSFQPSLNVLTIEEIFRLIDQDRDGRITFLEFAAAVIDYRKVEVQELDHAFQLLDKDQKGYLIKQDLLNLLTTDHSFVSNQINDSTTSYGKNKDNFTIQTEDTDTDDHDKINDKKILYQNSIPITSDSSAIVAYIDGNGNGNNNNSNQFSSNPIGLTIIPVQISSTCTTSPPTPRNSIRTCSRNNINRSGGGDTRKAMLEQEIDKIFDQADINHDGRISYSEYLFAMSEGLKSNGEKRNSTNSKSINNSDRTKKKLRKRFSLNYPKRRLSLLFTNNFLKNKKEQHSTKEEVKKPEKAVTDVLPIIRHNRRMTDSSVRPPDRNYRKKSNLFTRSSSELAVDNKTRTTDDQMKSKRMLTDLISNVPKMIRRPSFMPSQSSINRYIEKAFPNNSQQQEQQQDERKTNYQQDEIENKKNESSNYSEASDNESSYSSDNEDSSSCSRSLFDGLGLNERAIDFSIFKKKKNSFFSSKISLQENFSNENNLNSCQTIGEITEDIADIHIDSEPKAANMWGLYLKELTVIQTEMPEFARDVAASLTSRDDYYKMNNLSSYDIDNNKYQCTNHHEDYCSNEKDEINQTKENDEKYDKYDRHYNQSLNKHISNEGTNSPSDVHLQTFIATSDHTNFTNCSILSNELLSFNDDEEQTYLQFISSNQNKLIEYATSSYSKRRKKKEKL